MPLDAEFNPLYKIVLYICKIHCNITLPFMPSFSPVVSSFNIFPLKYYNHFSLQCYISADLIHMTLNTYMKSMVPAGRLPTLMIGPAVIIIGPPLTRLIFLPSLIQDSDWLTSRWWRGWWTMSMHVMWFHLPQKRLNVNIYCLLVSDYHCLQIHIYCCKANKKTQRKIRLPLVLCIKKCFK